MAADGSMMLKPLTKAVRQCYLRPPTGDDDSVDVDLFAGGGGASEGIEAATGRAIWMAVNHELSAVGMHQANHFFTRHYCCDVHEVDPVRAVGGRRVRVLWGSPDCTFFSKARGSAPIRRRDRRQRGLAWALYRWAKAVSPQIIAAECVEEITAWGPVIPKLDARGRQMHDHHGHALYVPDPSRAGKTWQRWVRQMENLGYIVEHRVLMACDYGAVTTRPRCYIICRRNAMPVWPQATHGPLAAQPHREGGEVIDWTLPTTSIFGRAKPMADKTLGRIARAVVRHVLQTPRPYLVPQSGRVASLADAAARRRRGIGIAGEQLDLLAPAIPGGVRIPLPASNGRPAMEELKQALMEVCAAGTLPAANDAHGAEAPAAFLLKYYSSGSQDQALTSPLHTLTCKARLALVVVHRRGGAITDIRIRMLQPKELYAAMGFPPDYVIDPVCTYRTDAGHLRHGRLPKALQVQKVGNSVSPPVAEAIIRANLATLEDAPWRMAA